MKLQKLHPWPTSVQEAQALQRHLAPQVLRQNSLPDPIRWVAGLDISAEDSDGSATGAAVLLSYPQMEIAEVQVGRAKLRLPYIPGLLAFRELPALAEALERLAQTPDLLLVDGQGLAHPRRFGIACHVGLLTGVPTIGCAKSILRGRHTSLPSEAGAWAELIDQGEVVGAAVRTRVNASPLFVSIGHRIDLPTAVHLVLACCKGYRMPEPTRLAHLAADGRLTEQHHKAGEFAAPQGRLI